MTIIHKGIRRKTTDVLDDYGQATYLQNVRLKRVGEMGRRAGLGKSNMAQLAGPVQFMIGAWSNEPFIVNGTGGDVTGNADPLAFWTGGTLRIPDGEVGQPVAPVITGVTYTPASGTVDWLTMTNLNIDVAVIYDGLSGPLAYEYSWDNYYTPMPPPPGNGVYGNPADFDLSGASQDGTYTGTIFVYPLANPALVDTFPISYTTLP